MASPYPPQTWTSGSSSRNAKSTAPPLFLFGLGLLRRSQLDKDLTRLRHLVSYSVGYLLYELLDVVGVEPVDDVDLGIHEHGIRSQMHCEQPEDLVDLLEGCDGLVHALSVFLRRRRTYQIKR